MNDMDKAFKTLDHLIDNTLAHFDMYSSEELYRVKTWIKERVEAGNSVLDMPKKASWCRLGYSNHPDQGWFVEFPTDRSGGTCTKEKKTGPVEALASIPREAP